MSFHSPIKIDERSPLMPLLSGMSVVAEELIAAPKTVYGMVTAPCQPADTIEMPDVPCGITAHCLDSLAQKIANYIAGTVQLLATIVLDTIDHLRIWVSNAFTCITGEPIHTGNINPHALEASRPYTLNRTKLGEDYHAAAALTVAELRDRHKITLDSLRDVAELSSCVADVRALLDWVQRHEQQRQKLIDECHNDPYDERLKPHPKKWQAAEMERMLLNIAYRLSRDDLTEHQRCAILAKIYDAMEGCGPHQYEGLKTGYETVLACTLQEKFAYWAKEFRIQLILKSYQDTQFHILNDARSKVPDWGLGGDRVQLADDAEGYGSSLGVSSPNYRYTLNRECTPATFLEMIKTNLDMSGPQQVINPFLGQLDASVLPEGISEVGEYWEQRIIPPTKDKKGALIKPGGIETLPTYKLVAFLLEQTGWFQRALVTI